jgi:REP element-mobilizing transposase RayT
MHLVEGEIYHVFNRGNNKEAIFFKPPNYLYFLEGIKRYVLPNCDILSWCLMPNHFHLLIHANKKSVEQIIDGSFPRQRFSQSIKQLLSSYTKAINKQEQRTGSLFQQKTKAILTKSNHSSTAFHYIHQNPLKARIVTKMEDWPYSSFKEYLRPELSICNKNLAAEILDLNLSKIYEDSYKVIDYNLIEN